MTLKNNNVEIGEEYSNKKMQGPSKAYIIIACNRYCIYFLLSSSKKIKAIVVFVLAPLCPKWFSLLLNQDIFILLLEMDEEALKPEVCPNRNVFLA
jgi:hypothetical protein